MAVYTTSGTLSATPSTNAPVTLTSWLPYVAVTVAASPAGTVYVNADGSAAAVTTGVDSVPVASGTTVFLRNRNPRPELQTVTPLPTDPSATESFTAAQTKVNLISTTASMVYTLALASSAGTSVVYG